MDFISLIKLIALCLAVGASASFVFGYFAFGNEPKPKRKGPPEFEDEFDENDNDEETIQQVVGTFDELQNGEMKECKVAGKNVLLVKDSDNVYAIGSKCTHLGAPLKNGVVADGHVRCPWHGACFSLKTGDIEEHPCENALKRFDLKKQKNGDLLLTANKSDLMSQHREPNFVKASKSNKKVAVVIGAGAAGGLAVEGLRQNGFSGKIVMIGNEKLLPYDRTKLSKALSSVGSKLQCRDQEFYDNLNIELKLNTTVVDFDAKNKTLKFSENNKSKEEELKFDYAVLATGGTPRSLPIDGFKLKNVYQLRTPEHSNAIAKSVSKSSKVVIIGSSFIGMEAAAALVSKAASVHVIGMEKVPFERVLGKAIGGRMQSLHESKGVVFHMERIVKKIVDNGNGAVAAVVLDNGDELDADVCVVGAGVVPTTKFVSGLETFRDGSIVCDETLQAAPGIFAVGDICRFPYAFSNDGSSIRVEHYGFAQQQGRIAGKNIALLDAKRKPQALQSVPFFWTAQFGKSLRYAGHAFHYDTVDIDGDLEALSFVGVLSQDDVVAAIVTLGRDPVCAAAAELFALDAMPAASEWRRARKPDLVKLLADTQK